MDELNQSVPLLIFVKKCRKKMSGKIRKLL